MSEKGLDRGSEACDCQHGVDGQGEADVRDGQRHEQDVSGPAIETTLATSTSGQVVSTFQQQPLKNVVVVFLSKKSLVVLF